MYRPFLSLAIALLAATSASAQPGNNKPLNLIPHGSGAGMMMPKLVMIPGTGPNADLIRANDLNGDFRLNADECPSVLRPTFSTIDRNRDGYVDSGELELAIGGRKVPFDRGKVIADVVYTVADDFVVDIWHNGVKVQDNQREMLAETFGATDEKIHRLEVREGDWLVFNVVNNRFRWGGTSYFAVAGVKPGGGVAFVSEVGSPQWSYCDSPALAEAFILDPAFLAGQTVRPSVGKWDRGDPAMNKYVDGWKGTPVWGNSRNTWIKYVAPKPTGGAASTIGTPGPLKMK